MCYNPNDLPPTPPGTPGTATGYDMELLASDGTRVLAYFAHPALMEATPDPRAHLIIYPDVRGLHNFYKELANQFAEQGIHALVIDYFGRTAPLHAPRDETFEFMPHVSQIQYPTFLLDVRAAIAYLQDHAVSSGAPSPAIFTCGFCMGGALSLLTAAQPDLPLAGAIAFYSGFGRRFAGTDTPTLDNTVNTRIPVLGLYGGADQGIPLEQIEQLEKNLTTAGVPHEIKVYEGAPHSFFDRKSTEFAEASNDSWTRALNFIHTNTPTS